VAGWTSWYLASGKNEQRWREGGFYLWIGSCLIRMQVSAVYIHDQQCFTMSELEACSVLLNDEAKHH